MVWGTVLLAACVLLGRSLGFFLSQWLGIDGDIGGVGFAMVALMLGIAGIQRRGLATPAFEVGVGYWAGMYIPIVVAMAATQNVWGATRGGGVAVAAGACAVLAGFAAVPLLTRGSASGGYRPID
jgi:malonate transporter MadL subunit